jgi:uncharacterized phage protein (TIGR01671 family)
MYRDIKFRIWDTKNKKWLIEPRLGISLLNCYPQVCDLISFDKIISQYVNAVDKNGKEAYEGDIVNVICSSLYHNRSEIGFTGVLIYDVPNSAFLVLNKEGELSSFGGMEVGFEIIGNIYENPELLDKKIKI